MDSIDFNKIRIFSYMDEHTIEMLKKIFVPAIIKKNEFIIRYGDEVPGLYTLVQGTVTVLGKDNKTPLATLTRESSFGEMSFLDEGFRASASIMVTSEKVEILFCEKELFKKLLLKEPKLSHPFYKGTSILIAERLRHANKEITNGYHLVDKMLKESKLGFKLKKTRSVLDKTGLNLNSQLIEILPIINEVLQDCPPSKKELEIVKKKIESVLFAEGQIFDRLSQQLDHILQHFENMSHIVNGESTLKVIGDTTIFNDGEAADIDEIFSME
ncbi:cyclic nucleotide-binding domain-containing protein [Desulfobacterales bacterium HSG16]|nr:cyclic nucleotide-binding domain-containing protein [Desulfobacterales bacterium HSG16]